MGYPIWYDAHFVLTSYQTNTVGALSVSIKRELFDIKNKNNLERKKTQMTMRNRKTIIVAFLIVVVMLLGIGYAALTDNLTINGEATVNTTAAQNQWEEDIYFSAAEARSSTGTSGIADTAAVDSGNNDNASFSVKSLARKGEKAVFVFTITNEGDTGYDAAITVDPGYPTNSNAEYFTVTYDYGNSTVAAGGTLDVTVTVELIKDPVENTTAAFTVNLTATSVE